MPPLIVPYDSIAHFTAASVRVILVAGSAKLKSNGSLPLIRYSVPVFVEPDDFLMYSQPVPLQEILPSLEASGQPFSMTRSVQVIAPFSTTGSPGMVKVTVFLLPLTWSPSPRSLPFRLKISVSALMVTVVPAQT